MRRPAIGTIPVSYSKHAHTFRTAGGNSPAARARLGSPVLGNLDVICAVPAGLVAEHILERRPTGIQDGLRHLGFDQLGRAHIPDNDSGIGTGDLGGCHVQFVFPAVGDFGVNSPNPVPISGSLGAAKRSFVFPIVTGGVNDKAVTAHGQRFQAEIDADMAIAARQIVGNVALEIDVPAPARIFSERARFELAANVSGLPEVELAFEVADIRAVDLGGTRDKRHPPERALRTKAGAKTWAPFVKIAGRDELATDHGDSVRMQAEIGGNANREFAKIETCGPTHLPTGVPTPLRFPLGGYAKVPDLVASDSVSPQVLSCGRVLDTIPEGQHGHVRTIA